MEAGVMGKKPISDDDFVVTLRKRAEHAAHEHEALVFEIGRVDMRIARTKKYIEDLNAFLVSEGEEPVLIPEA